MSLNASLSSNHSPFSLPLGLSCLIDAPFSFLFTSHTSFNVLVLLPICIVVLHHGRLQCSVSTATPTGHSDSFTFHLVTMEMVFIISCVLGCFGIYMVQSETLLVGIHLFAITWFGEAFFHVLTCLEHYLAVVHPIVYLNLKNDKWVQIRNASIGFVWMLCFGGSILLTSDRIALRLMFCLLISSLVIISFCCISVLRVLTHPGPGKPDQGRVDQSKRRAFYTIAAVLAVLVLRCSWNLVWALFTLLNVGVNLCVLVMGELWINIPSTLVLPLLFLQRAGKLAWGKKGIR